MSRKYSYTHTLHKPLVQPSKWRKKRRKRKRTKRIKRTKKKRRIRKRKRKKMRKVILLSRLFDHRAGIMGIGSVSLLGCPDLMKCCAIKSSN